MKQKIIILIIILILLTTSYFLWNYFRVIRKEFVNFWDVKYIEIDKKRDSVYVTLSNGKKYIVEFSCCHALIPTFYNRGSEQPSQIVSKAINDIKFIDSKVVVYYKDGDYEIHDLEKEILNINIFKTPE